MIKLSEVTNKRNIDIESLCYLVQEIEVTRGTTYSSAAYGLLKYIKTGRILSKEYQSIRNLKGSKAWKLINEIVKELETQWHLLDAPKRAIQKYISVGF